MGFRERVVADVARILGATGEFGEVVRIAGADVPAICSEGDSRIFNRSAGGALHPALDGGPGHLLQLGVAGAVVLANRAVVLWGGRTWRVNRLLGADRALRWYELTAEESAFGGR